MMSPSQTPKVDDVGSEPESAALTHTLKQNVLSGSSTEITQIGPGCVPAHLESYQFWQPGRQVGDFVLLSKLGQGGLGTVFLAKQISLDRQVALKVTEATVAGATEGLALANLEHDNIVKVYSGFSELTSKKHCLCLQYVPGTTLGNAIAHLYAKDRRPATGNDFLAAIDALASGESRFDPASLRDRAALEGDDFIQAVCRIGEQLAGALAFAHGRGVLHCDVKPGNILITPYGRPMLVDFNVSVSCGASVTGGTPKYMSPEQMAAACGMPDAVAVDERSDLYSLGIVLFQLATGVLPSEATRKLEADLPPELAAVIRRCLQANPMDRYQSAAALREALAGARAIHTAQRRLPLPHKLGRWTIRHPILVLLAFALLPHFVGTFQNVIYNAVELNLKERQQRIFTLLVIGYDLLAYSVCVTIAIRLLRRFHHDLTRVRSGGATPDQFDAVRQRAIDLGRWGIGLAVVGWLPGGILFPLVIDHFGGEGGLSRSQYVHFLISFVLSGIVGMVYSYYGILYVVLRGLYPYLWSPERFHATTAAAELDRGTHFFGPFMVLANLIPLSGAILLIVFGEKEMTLGFRLLVSGLIGVGMAGVTGLVRVIDHLNHLANAWTETREGTS